MKREIVVFLDTGLIGTFVKWEADPSEDDYLYLYYVPLNKFPAKKVRYPKPIPRSAIHPVDPTANIAGVQDRIIYIYTAEEGSIISNILGADSITIAENYKDEIKTLKMKNAALNQEVENARSGVGKAIASVRNIQKQSNQEQSNAFGGFRRSVQDFGDLDDD